MKRIVVLAAAAATLAAALLATAGSAQQGQGKGQERTIVLTERNEMGTFKYIDNAPRHGVDRRGEPRRFSTGDAFVGTTPLYDAANATRLGTFHFACSVVRGSRRFSRTRFLCDGLFALSDGTMTAQASFSGSEDPVTGAVTGGTGNYEGASGTLTTDEQGRLTKDTIHLVR